MTRTSTSKFPGTARGIAAAVAAVSMVASSWAGPVEPLRPSDMLVLTAQGHNGCAGSQVLCGSSGVTIDRMISKSGICSPLSIAAQQVFVVTSMDWWNQDNTTPTISQVRLKLGSVYVLSGSAVSDRSKVGGTVTVNPGVPIAGPITQLCLEESGIGAPTPAPNAPMVHGYLTTDR